MSMRAWTASGAMVASAVALVISCSADVGVDMLGSAQVACADASVAPEGGGVQGGKLVIAGGALQDASPIWDRLLREGGGARGARILIATAATLHSGSNFAYYQDLFTRQRGVPLDNIQQIRVATRDDPETLSEDESSWRANGDLATEADRVRDWADIVFFSGGDQAYITSAFLKPDGTDRAITKAIRDKLAAGKLIVGGSSAGAAIMSDPMIGEGGTLETWSNAPHTSMFYPSGSDAGTFNAENALVLNKGLGFLNAAGSVLIDTHWFPRARFMRTIRALDSISRTSDPKMKSALGVGENTAILVDLSSRTLEVLGDPDVSFVGVIGIAEATLTGGTPGVPYAGQKVRLGFLGARDRYMLAGAANPLGSYFAEASKTAYTPCNGGRNRPSPLIGDWSLSSAYIEALEWLSDGDLAGPTCHTDGLIPVIRPDAGSSFQFDGYFLRLTTDAKTKSYWSENTGWEFENGLLQFGAGTGSYNASF